MLEIVRKPYSKGGIQNGSGTTAIGSFNGQERVNSTPNTAWVNGNLQPRSSVGVGGWKITKETLAVKEDSG